MTDIELPAGRELDALVAEKVFGYLSGPDYSGMMGTDLVIWGVPAGETPGPTVPHYSTSIADAWAVVARMGQYDRGWGYEIDGRDPYSIGAQFLVAAWHAGYEYAETAPLAICRAALVALGVVPSAKRRGAL